MPVFLTKQEWEILRVALSYFYRGASRTWSKDSDKIVLRLIDKTANLY
jgi:hypothetical protein